MTDEIRSPRNPRIIDAAKLQRGRIRRERAQMLLEGPHLVAEAMAADITIHTVFAVTDDPTPTPSGAEQVTVTAEVLAKLSDTAAPQSPVAVAAIPMDAAPAGPHVILWGLRDPGNVGTIIRTAAAMGFDVVVGPETVDVWSPKVLRSAAGGHFRTRIRHAAVPTLHELATWPHPLVVSVVDGGRTPAAAGWSTAGILIGNEAHGLPAEVAGLGQPVTIPMPGGTESLNAAVAAAILMWEATKSRSEGVTAD